MGGIMSNEEPPNRLTIRLERVGKEVMSTWSLWGQMPDGTIVTRSGRIGEDPKGEWSIREGKEAAREAGLEEPILVIFDD